MTRLRDRAFLHGLLIGLLLPLLAIAVLQVAGELRAWFVQGAVYGLMPLFVVLGIPAYALTRRLKDAYAARGVRALHLTHGILLGSWIIGALLMWLATPPQDTGARLVSSMTGSVMLVAFWAWAGSLVAHYEPRGPSAEPPQAPSSTTRPRQD